MPYQATVKSTVPPMVATPSRTASSRPERKKDQRCIFMTQSTASRLATRTGRAVRMSASHSAGGGPSKRTSTAVMYANAVASASSAISAENRAVDLPSTCGIPWCSPVR